MEGSKQEIRRSQFVQVYGPGALIEGPNGSRLIPTLEGLGKENCNDHFFTKHEIKDIRMSHLLNKKNKKEIETHLLEIPSSTSQSDEKTITYRTILFPMWHVCYKKETPLLYRNNINKPDCGEFDPEECGKCEKDNNPNVRFIRACPDGHLDEVDWWLEIHDDKNMNCKHKGPFYWKVTGSTLADITIECPKCGNKTNIDEIYSNERLCTGRLPEKETIGSYKINVTKPKRPKKKCEQTMRVLQKQSSSLRLAITKTLLKIPKFDEPVLDSIVNYGMKAAIDALRDIEGYKVTKEDIIKEGRKHLDEDGLDELIDYLKNKDANDYLKLTYNANNRDKEFTDAINEEFESLRIRHPEETANFSKLDFVDYKLKGLNYSFPLEVCGINKLTTVTAQLAYQRIPHTKKNKKTKEIEEGGLIDIGYLDDDVNPKKKWYPAFKGVGEGLFITSKKNPLIEIKGLEEVIELWETKNIAKKEERDEVTNPLFVWWHTLSHAILKSLSLSCGYNSTSLHERVYIEESSGEGGILIYNTSPGDDSGMGGLVDIVYNENEFKKVLSNAMNSLLICSNDPICSSLKLEEDGVNGSACHNCVLISETSCEHQNTLLDRHFFIK